MLSTRFAITMISNGPGYIGIGNKAPGGPPDQYTPDAQSPLMNLEAVYIQNKYIINIIDRILSLLDIGLRGLLAIENPLDIADSPIRYHSILK